MADLPAGRELDARVAKEVMGWTPRECGADVIWTHLSHGWMHKPPPYSTSIADAWEVVEKLNCPYQVGRSYSVESGEPVGHFAMFGEHKANAETAPHAICLAVLRAVQGTEGRPPTRGEETP